jgi:outer membrane biogenesis lipoprotein LolB
MRDWEDRLLLLLLLLLLALLTCCLKATEPPIRSEQAEIE